MAKSEFSRQTVKTVMTMLREGKDVQQVSDHLNVPVSLVAALDHQLAINDGGLSILERLTEVASENLRLSEVQQEEKEKAAKQLCVSLLHAGMKPAQIHITTGLSINICRHIYQRMRKQYDLPDAAIPMPTNIASRLVMSIFATHYTYLQAESEINLIHLGNMIHLGNIVVAWMRTVESVTGAQIDKLPEFDPRFLSIGSLFEVAKGLREVRTPLPEQEDGDDPAPVRKIYNCLCPVCGSEFIAVFGTSDQDAEKCCFCELIEAAEKAA
ncbi:hypothetical protein [Sutterella sp.]|uniref:hypothetical protein n=1 Tax=Sutterella sp. TaxID=1981025 RepID=UPI003FD790B8